MMLAAFTVCIPGARNVVVQFRISFLVTCKGEWKYTKCHNRIRMFMDSLSKDYIKLLLMRANKEKLL